MSRIIYEDILKTLVMLKNRFPTYSFGQHISTAFSDYGDIWGLSDKECAFALEKYAAELEFNIVSDDEVQKIVEEGKNLDKLFQEEEDEDGY